MPEQLALLCRINKNIQSHMKKVLTLFGLILLSFSLQAQPYQKRIDSLMNYYASSFDFNGAAFVSLKGTTLHNKGYGYKDRYAKLKNDANGIFMIGSITKQFTAEIILMLAKEGKLHLDDKLSLYYPDYKSSEKISLEQLLTHTSGIYNYTDDTLWSKHPTEAVSHEQMLSIFKDKPLNFEPGAKFEYSNSNYILLTYIIEQVCGKPYTQVARERIIGPLGMTYSGFDFTHLRDRNKTTGYNSVIIDSFYADQIEDSTQSLGAGALYSTTADLYKWHRALQSYTLLDKDWQRRAYTPHLENYGYGWIVKKYLDKEVLAHSGGIGGFYTYILRIEREDLCIILLSNIRHTGADNNKIARDIVRCLYDTTFAIPSPRKAISLSPKIADAYVGEYTLALDTSISLSFRRQNNYFLMKLSGQPEDRIYPQTQTMFFAKSADARFEFVKDPTKGYKLLLHQHGQTFEASRK
jgi:CubicO group peptidase (beta-lactamase class C family)